MVTVSDGDIGVVTVDDRSRGVTNDYGLGGGGVNNRS